MDLEDNETAMTSFDTQVEDLKGTIESLEVKLEESKAQVKNISVCLKFYRRDDGTLILCQHHHLAGVCLGNAIRGGPVPELCAGVSIRHS